MLNDKIKIKNKNIDCKKEKKHKKTK